jgi:predicted nucleotidyltransferase
MSEFGTIRTGADLSNVADTFRPVHEAASAMIHERGVSVSVYAYGSVVTGQAIVGVSDVDLLTIGLPSSDADLIGAEISTLSADVVSWRRDRCRPSR